jgi:hypothetical protein
MSGSTARDKVWLRTILAVIGMAGTVWFSSSAYHNGAPFFLAAVILGVIAGLATGGKLDHILFIRLHATRWLFAIVVIQVDVFFVSLFSDLGGALYWLNLIPLVGAGAWIFYNIAVLSSRRLRVSLGVVGLGWFMNVLVIVLNNGMPVSTEAEAHLGQPVDTVVEHVETYRTVAMDDETVFPWLGDYIITPVVENVISPGDLVLLAGIALFIGVGSHLRDQVPEETLV